MPVNKQIILQSRPVGKLSPESFRLVETSIPGVGDGQILVRQHYLSLDPYMRGRLNDAKSYTRPQALGEVMGGETVGEVVESRLPGFDPGDFVIGHGGWQSYALTTGAGFRKIDIRRISPQAYLGVVGMPGVTAWYGLNKIIAPKAGETVLVSAASGAVGSVVGQLAKFAGARVVGIAGGPEKCAYVSGELGFDLCVDHKSPHFADELKAALPDGVDGLFENVGGESFTLSLRRLNDFARIAICGLIASYEGPATTLPDMRVFLVRRIKVEGFIVSDHRPLWPQALSELAEHVAEGRLRYRETIRDGLEAAPEALIDLLHGGNFGKMLVKLT